MFKYKNEFELYSFDVFDTLITRQVALPYGIFQIIQEKIKNDSNFPKILKDEYVKIRVDAENAIKEKFKRKYDTREINFNDIYNCMQEAYSFDDTLISNLKCIEINTEKENIVPIKDNIILLKELIKKEKRVILISDMYFSSEVIREFLVNIDEVFKNIKIYVSNEYKASKSTGKLYKIIQKEEKISCKNWFHIGDNKNSDYIQAKKLGIRAVEYKETKLKKYEKYALNTYFESVSIQKQIALAKYLRINKTDNKQLQNYEKYDFGVSYAGVFLYNYVKYIINTSLKNDFKMIYFIARDGYILKLIADIIINNEKLNIKTEYIYGSRLAWRIPNAENYEKIIETIFLKEQSSKNLSVDILSYKLGITAENLLKYLPVKSKKRVFKKNEKENIRNIFLQNESLRNEILELNKEKEDILLKYIKQEINLTDENIVFADINGSGDTTDILAQFINKVSNEKKKIHIFFARLIREDLTDEITTKHVYLKKPLTNNVILEMLCRTTSGQTTGYFEKENKIFPVLDEFDSSKIIEWGYNDYIQGVKDYANLASKINIQDDVNICYEYYKFIEEKCDKETAEILGDIPFLRLGSEKNIKKSAPKISLIKVIMYLIFGESVLKDIEIPKLSLYRSVENFEKYKDILKADLFFDKVARLKLYYYLKKYKSKKILLWGASIFLYDFLKKYGASFNNIVGIIDRNSIRKGDSVGKYTIIKPEDLENVSFDYVVCTIKNKNKTIYPEIKKFIQESCPKQKLLPNIFAK